ncbi:unnamed protein product [Calypogeia fissa]
MIKVSIQSGNPFWSSQVGGSAMAVAATVNLGAGVEIFTTNSFSGNHSSSLGQKSSKIVSNVLLYQRGSTKVSNLQASSSSSSTSWSSRVIRNEAGPSNGTEQDQNGALVSRRWATVALPGAFATLCSSIAFSNVVAMAEDVAIETRYGESGSGTISTDVAVEGGDGENGAGKVGQDADIDGGDVENGLRLGRVELRTLKGCGLGVARYPDFVYNAEGGGGTGKAEQLADGRIYVHFDAEGLYIPAVCFDTTTILGLPLPPGLKIEVVPKTLEGYVEKSTGKVELNFVANFNFTVGNLYRAPPLVVDTKLTTESAQGEFRGGQGQRLDSSGNVKLVAVARLAPVNDRFLSTFLTLPTDCLAELSANLSFS